MFVSRRRHRPVFPRQPSWQSSGFGGSGSHRAREAAGFPTSGLTDFLSLLPQHGVRCSPTCRPLSRDSGPSGRIKLRRGSRNCSTLTRICIQVCKLLEMVSENGMGSLSCTWWSVPLSQSPPGPDPQPSSACVRPLLRPRFLRISCVCPHSPGTPLLPLTPPPSEGLALSFRYHALWLSVLLGQGSVNFLVRTWIVNVFNFLYFIVYYSSSTSLL